MLQIAASGFRYPSSAGRGCGNQWHRFQFRRGKLRGRRRRGDGGPTTRRGVKRIQVDELLDAVRVGGTEFAQFKCGERVPDEDGLADVQLGEHGDVVVRWCSHHTRSRAGWIARSPA